MSFAIGMYLRDTSLKFQQQSLDMTRAALGSITKNTAAGAYNSNRVANPYLMDTKYGQESINWLL